MRATCHKHKSKSLQPGRSFHLRAFKSLLSVAGLTSLVLNNSAAHASEGTWLPSGESKTHTTREFRFVLGSGARWVDVGELNDFLGELDAQTYSNRFAFRPASVSAEFMSRGNGYGFEFVSFDNPNSDEIQGGMQNNLTFFQLVLSYYRVVYEQDYLRVSPGVSLGFAEMHNVFQPHSPEGIPFEDLRQSLGQSAHLVTNAYITSLFTHVEVPLWLWGTPGTNQGGLGLGVRGGYTLELSKSASDETWVQHGQQMLGGPELSFSGWFVQGSVALIFGT